MPMRVKLSRTKGWRMPPGAVKVDRTTPWGNPFIPSQVHASIGRAVVDRAEAFRLYESYATTNDALKRKARAELHGKDLACWCADDATCHATVLLDLANAPDERPMPNEATT